MDDAAEAHRAAVVAALLGVLGSAIVIVGFWRISGLTLRSVQFLALLINGGALWWLYARLPPFKRSRSHALFLLILVPTAAMTWLIDDARAAHGACWAPYEPNKLSALTLAIIAPPGWRIGMLAILLFVVSALVHHVMLGEVLRARMASGEPVGVIAYGVFALVVLGFNQRGYALRGELQHERAEKVALERVARVSLALRDLANTPVQTLELIRQRLLIDSPQLRIQTDRMGRALERLRRLNDILAPYQTSVIWDQEVTTLERELRKTKPRLPASSRRRF